MSPKRIVTIAMGVWVILGVLIILGWQVTPATAGFTPVPTDTTAPRTTSTPRAIVTPRPPHDSQPSAPEMPVIGEQINDPSNSGVVLVLLSGMAALLLISTSLVIRQSARTKTKK